MNSYFPLGDSIDRVERKYADAPNDLPLQSEHRMFIGNALSRRQHIGIMMLCLAVFLIFSARLMQLQIVQGGEYRNLAEGNRLRTIPTPAKRGLIVDSRGMILAENVPSFYLSIVPEFLPSTQEEKNRLLSRIADVTGITPIEMEEELQLASRDPSEAVLIHTELEKTVALEAMVELRDDRAVIIAVGSKRQYPRSEEIPTLSHLLGYEGKLNQNDMAEALAKGYLRSDVIGRTGIESQYETELRGIYGKRKVEVDALGNIDRIIANEDKIDGATLRTSLDIRLQEAAERALANELKKTGTKKGVVIALDPRNGHILAMVSVPAYDNNVFGGGITKKEYQVLTNDETLPLFNRAIAGEYPSGSTLKIVYAGAGLAEGIITDATTVNSTGGLSIGQWFFPDWKAGGHGLTNVRKAIAWSVNTFFYELAGGYDSFKGLGITKMMEWVQRFGMNQKLGIDIPGERPGFYPSPEWKREVMHEPWYIGDTYHVGIGQGSVLVTPLQVAAYTMVYANGGTLYRPTIAASIEEPDMPARKLQPTVIRDRILPQTALDIVKKGMREGVTYGSARSLNDLKFTVAGKTGTAQFQSNKEPHAWFTGFAPYEKPEIVVTVLVEEGKEGSTVAIPVAKEVLQAWHDQKE